MSGPGGYDPGWNDPPKLSYNPQNVASKPRNLLNKRVPFSLNSSAVNTNADVKPLYPQPPVGMPPLPQNMNCTPMPQNNSTIICDTNKIECDEFSVSEVASVLNGLVEACPELGTKMDGIKKRIELMESMWKDGKLCKEVQSRTYQLAKALESSDAKLADTIHKSLMVDYASSVSPWMVGVKQLIMTSLIRNELLEIDKE